MKVFLGKSTCVLLTVCLFAVFLCSCAAEGPEVIRRTTVHIADYTIVRGDEANNEVLKQALNIRSSICLKYNRNVIRMLKVNRSQHIFSICHNFASF